MSDIVPEARRLRAELDRAQRTIERVTAKADEWEQMAYSCERPCECAICATYQGVVLGVRAALREDQS